MKNEVKIEDMMDYYNNNKDFKEYIDKLMHTYGWELERALESPITKEYYKYITSS